MNLPQRVAAVLHVLQVVVQPQLVMVHAVVGRQLPFYDNVLFFYLYYIRFCIFHRLQACMNLQQVVVEGALHVLQAALVVVMVAEQELVLVMARAAVEMARAVVVMAHVVVGMAHAAVGMAHAVVGMRNAAAVIAMLVMVFPTEHI
jgi:hypothetical protein